MARCHKTLQIQLLLEILRFEKNKIITGTYKDSKTWYEKCLKIERVSFFEFRQNQTLREEGAVSSDSFEKIAELPKYQILVCSKV